MSPRPTISATLIVKNAEDTIRRCVWSFVEHVDEVIVVDTGSEDGTLGLLDDIALSQSHLAVIHFDWIDDFAAARNIALDAATGDWMFWVDADDEVIDARELRALAAEAEDTTGGIYLPYDYAASMTFFRERLVRNDGRYHWRYPIHEVLWCDSSRQVSGTAKSDRVRIVHRREEGSGATSNARNLRIHEAYLRRCASEGSMPDARSFFYYGNDLRSAGRFEESMHRYWQALHRSTWDDERYQCLHFIGDCLHRLGRLQEAIEANLMAIEIKPDWPDAYYGIAAAHHDLMEWEAVLHWSGLGDDRPVPDTASVLYDYDYSYWPHVYAAWAAFELGRLEDALGSAIQAESAYPTRDMGRLIDYLGRLGIMRPTRS